MTSNEQHPTIIQTAREMSGAGRVLILGTFVNNLASFLNAFLVLFLIHRGFSPWQAGLALAGLLVGRVFGTAVGGTLADRVGYRWTIIGSMGVGAVLIVALVHAPDPWTAAAVACATGVAAQAFRPASMAWLVDLTPKRQQVMVFAMYRLSFNIGSTVGPLLAALLLRYSYDLLFYADAATSLGFCLIALVVLPADHARDADDADPADEPDRPATKKTGYREVFADRRFLLVTGGLFFTAIAYIQMSAALPLYVTGTGHTEQVYAILLSVNGFIVIAFEIFLSKWLQRLPIGLPMAAGMALLSLGHLLYLAPSTVVLLVIATVTWTFGEVVAAPSMMAYPGLVAPDRLRARYIAAATVPQQIGYAIGPMVGVAAWNLWGSTVWVITGACAAVATVLVLLGAGLGRRPEPTPGPIVESEPVIAD